jgi:hypothetical protein
MSGFFLTSKKSKKTDASPCRAVVRAGVDQRSGPTEFAHALLAKLDSVVGLKAACKPGFATNRNTPATQHLR